MTVELLLAFTGVALLAYITPGPDWFVVMRHATTDHRTGIISALGVQSGLAVHMSAAALGVASLVLASTTAFTVLKIAGAAYLVYLGIQALVHARRTAHGTEKHRLDVDSKRSRSGVYGQSLLANVLNPKAALFFIAVLPQFLVAGAPMLPQVLLLGALDILLGFVWWICFVFGLAHITRLLSNRTSRVVMDRVSGVALIVLGGALALTNRP